MAGIDLAIIGGTGVYRLATLEGSEAVQGDTPYGAPSGPVRVGRLAGLVRRAQTGQLYWYALVMVVGVFGFLTWRLWPMLTR